MVDDEYSIAFAEDTAVAVIGVYNHSEIQKANLSEIISGYHKIDIVSLITQNQRLLTTSEGWIIKSAVKNSGFSAISTGDSFYAPQILEVTFR